MAPDLNSMVGTWLIVLVGSGADLRYVKRLLFGIDETMRVDFEALCRTIAGKGRALEPGRASRSLLGEDRPPLMVAPATVDLEVTG